MLTGQFLSLVYFNDLPEKDNHCMKSLFADDTTVHNISPKAGKKISSDFQSIRGWFDLNKLTVIKGKSEYVCFGRVQPLDKEAFVEKIS